MVTYVDLMQNLINLIIIVYVLFIYITNIYRNPAVAL